MNYRFAARTSLVFALLPFAACSDDAEDAGEGADAATESGDGDGDPTTGDGDGDPTTGDGDGDPTTGDGDGDPTTGDGDGDPSGDGDGDPTTGDGDGDPTTGDGDGDPVVDESVYTATLMPGPPDRIIITRTNNGEPSCTHMVLRRPHFDTFDITMPMGWAIETALLWQQGFCPMNLANPDGEPMSGTGTIQWGSLDALQTYPCTINFDIEINNATDPPSMSTWSKTGVAVEGVNCG